MRRRGSYRGMRIAAVLVVMLWSYQMRFQAARLCSAFNDAPGSAKWLDDNLVLAVGRAKAFLTGVAA